MLLERQRMPVVEAVERLCGMQAQEPRPPFVGLWSRLEGFRPEDPLTALRDRRLLRATLMRATLHLTSAADYAALRMSLQPVMTAALRALGDRAEGLDLDAVTPAARALLHERPRRFDELRALLFEAFPGANDRALGYAVRTHLPLVMVPTDDRWGFPRAAEFTLAEQWIDEPLQTGEKLPALVLRYLAAFGPATAADVQTWSGLKAMKGVLNELRDELLVFKDERGRELFDLPDAPRPDEDAAAPPRFLPEFDNLVLAHADRTRFLADDHRAAVITRNLRVRATFLWDGSVAGTWTVERRKKTATLRMTPFEPLPARAAKALTHEARALLDAFEADAGTRDVDLTAPS